ncbi:MAG: hypothetical protein M3N13_08490 [Candidatus Eremiobacteraeota bacterium]|nr:hypothetical protein [Candidatus Eremiobacteraeota bacterium]
MRPLTLGELLDRAVTLFVKNAWLFVALAALVYVPVAIAQLSMGDFWVWYMNEFSKVIAQPGDPATALALDRALVQKFGPVGLFTFIILVAAGPLVASAMAHVTGNLLAGTATSFGEALRFALTRWGRVVLFALLWIVSLFAVFFGVMLVLTLLTVGLTALLKSAAIAVVFVIAIFVATIFLIVVASVSMGVGFMAAIIENANVLTAFGSGIARTINRQMFWRSTIFGLVLFAISLGFSIIGSLAGFGLLAALKTGIPLVVINAVVAIIQYGFFVVFIALFYYDLRVRREGVDLESMAARLA